MTTSGNLKAGDKKYQWLSIHGVAYRTDGTHFEVKVGENADDPVFCISDILPHIAQEQMKKSADEFVEGEGKKAILKYLKETCRMDEEDFRSAELEVVPAGNARDSVAGRYLILAYGQDDRSCAYPSLMAKLRKVMQDGNVTWQMTALAKVDVGDMVHAGDRSRRACPEHARSLGTDQQAGYPASLSGIFRIPEEGPR